jgi:Cu(I)/Ag(I) efflux system membrane protein CusA/SilA
MVRLLISWSLRNRFIVLVISAGMLAWGLYEVKRNPVDAIPDLSENQVIVFTEWMGRSPQVIEDQVTYPLVSRFQGIPKLKNARGVSMFGMSFVYLIFDDDVDIYWARTRVTERLNSASGQLPEGVTPTLGPEGTGVGHILWYTLDSKGMDPGELRTIQDWYVRYPLQTVPGVAEVASFGGFQKQYQVVIDPVKLSFYNLSMMDVLKVIKENNNDAGGRKFEMNDMAYIVRGLGYVKSREDLENIALRTEKNIPLRIRDIATVQMGGDIRYGIFDENGEGEKTGGIVVMRYGENADKVIRDVKAKMEELKKSLPEGVTFNIAYDRSELIEDSIHSVRKTLIEVLISVSIVILLFLFNWRSALIILLQIPVAVASSFILLNLFGFSSNIMSLTGIALAISVIVDDGIVMVENTYRNLAGDISN